MKTGIVILNYNDYENTLKMVSQIKDYDNLSYIIIVDNASTIEESKKLKYLENEKIKVIYAKENKGYASGNNLGIEYLEKNTDATLVIISNPDIKLSQSIIEEMIKDMKKHEEISFLGPKILEREKIIKGWKLPTYKYELLSTINYFSKFAPNLLKYKTKTSDKLIKVDVIHGCFFMARLKDFKKINYFDPNTFLYYEENIIAHKAKEANLITMVDTKVSVTHELSKSVNKSLSKVNKYKILKKSMFYYETKYNHLKGIKLWILKLVYYLSLGVAYLTFWI